MFRVGWKAPAACPYLQKTTATADALGVLAGLIHAEGDAVDEDDQHGDPLEPRVAGG